MTCLLYRADGDTRSAGHNEVTIFDVWSNLIQHERNDVRLHSQEENIASAHCLFVAGGEIDTQFLHKGHLFSTSLGRTIHRNSLHAGNAMFYTLKLHKQKTKKN